MKENLKKGQRVFLSSIGHNNFFYPCDKQAKLLYDVIAEVPSFVGGGENRRPVLLPESAVFISGRHDRKIVAWKEK